MKKFTFIFDEQQATVIMQALADVRYRIAAPVIENMAAQLSEQQHGKNEIAEIGHSEPNIKNNKKTD